jgi:hypothetical protein
VGLEAAKVSVHQVEGHLNGVESKLVFLGFAQHDLSLVIAQFPLLSVETLTGDLGGGFPNARRVQLRQAESDKELKRRLDR